MKRIFKYPLSGSKMEIVLMPKGAEVLCVQTDNKTGAGAIWALCATDKPLEERYFETFGTGWEVHDDIGVDRKYIGTYQQGGFVWHIFERLN